MNNNFDNVEEMKELIVDELRACGHFFRPLCLYSFYNLED